MRFKSKYISGPALYSFAIWALLIIFFQLWRYILLLNLSDRTEEIPGSVIIKSFIVGLRFDIAIACYMIVFLYLLAVLPGIEIFKNKLMRRVNLSLLFTFVSIVFFIHLCDIEFYKFFNSRLNGMAMQWSDDPGFMFTMIWQTYNVVLYFLIYFVVLGLFFWSVFRILKWLKGLNLESPKWVNFIYFPIVILLLIFGGRGRIEEKAPLTWGAAYFSEYHVANQLSLNPTFTFLRDAVYDAGSKKETDNLMREIAIPNSDSILTDVFGFEIDSNKVNRKITFISENPNPPNVILVIMESFGASRIGCLDNRYTYDLSPNFNSLADFGTLFTNFYSSGSHTYSGIFCTLYGYPLIFGKSVMKQVSGQNKFWGLPNIFSKHGYETIFFTTHDPHFDNMQGFLMSNGIKRIHSLFDYDSSEKLSTLGVPDHVMFDKAVKEFKEIESPYFATLLTASNHGPWFVPEVDFDPLPDTIDDSQRLNAFKYADWALGRFIRNIINDTAFSNTIIVVTSDNGMPYNSQLDLEITQYHIPLLFLHTDSMYVHKKERIGVLGSQIDILPTIMGRVGLSYDNYSFGRDLFDSTLDNTPFAQFSDWYMVGYIEDDYYSISRINGPSTLHIISEDQSKDVSDSLSDKSQSMSQKGLSIFQKAYFNMLAPVK